MKGSDHVMGASEVVHIKGASRYIMYTCILMEKAEGGDLVDLFESKDIAGLDKTKMQVRAFRDAAVGLNEVHEMG